MQRCALGVLHAMHGPQHLLAVRQRDRRERLAARVVGGERHVRARMPVLRDHHLLEAPREPVDHRHHRVAVGHRERAARHEIVLHVDHEQHIVATHAGILRALQPLKPLPAAASFAIDGAGCQASPFAPAA